MIRILFFISICFLVISCSQNSDTEKQSHFVRTTVSIVDSMFYINGEPTFEGRTWNGYQIEGLLPNARLVQGIFDDLNPETAERWKYPDTQEWSAERNTNEFVDAMDDWYAHGLLSFTINMQGGSPMGYGNKNWYNSAYYEDGALREDYMVRLEKILDKSDSLGMVPMLGLFYFGQDQNLRDAEAIKNATRNTINWLFDKGYRNVLIELGNESNNNKYDHGILKADSVHVLMNIVKNMVRDGHRYPVSTSFNGNTIPTSNVVEVADYILIHGNGVNDPDRIVEMVEIVRAMPEYKTMPIVFNEDDHFDFGKEWNNFIAATSVYASWGYFDFRMQDEGFNQGFQSVPIDWSISSERKKGFFNLLKEMTGK